MREQTFLVEIGTEELPPKELRSIAESFSMRFSIELTKSHLSYDSISWFATPRRLALKVANLSTKQADRWIKKSGPIISQAFDVSGKPTKEAEGWARSCGITINQAERVLTNQGERLLYKIHVKGQAAKKLLVNAINKALSSLFISKIMRWGNSEVKFIRPVHTVTLLLGRELIPGIVLGVESARIIRGHRFMGETEFTIDDANQYPEILLNRGKVMADYEARKTLIKDNSKREAKKIGGQADLNESLLEEIVSLVEWPVVLVAKFEKKFLSLPTEALVSTMKGNQKYFPIYCSSTGKLLPNFIFVANMESKYPEKIIDGNEKVVRSRLSDAEFFFNTDRQKRLEDYLPYLNNLLFQQQLGTFREKTNRIQVMAGQIASQIGGNVDHAMRAGLLSKCDLMTHMVFEFNDTQGVIGMHYARHDGEVEDVAISLSEQYHPRFSGDTLPQSSVACALAIADKVDTLVGIFGIGEYPKGDKDPFALRRAALGVLRIIIEQNLPIDLSILIKETVRLYGAKIINLKVVDDVIKFMLGRFQSWYQKKGHAVDTIQAVLALNSTKPADLNARVNAVSHFRTLKKAPTLISAYKRISNILAKSTDQLSNQVNVAILQKTAEIQLASDLVMLREKLESCFSLGYYRDALVILSTLEKPVAAFFDSVMVMTKDDTVRVNRLTLLSQLRKLFLRVADISMLR